MRQQAKIVALPVNAAERTERQLIAAWADCDRIEAEHRAAMAKARALECEVADARGYGRFIRRAALESALRAQPAASHAKANAPAIEAGRGGKGFRMTPVRKDAPNAAPAHCSQATKTQDGG